MPRHWLLKTEPSAYSFERLRHEGMTPWTGVRNFQARNNMLEMRLGEASGAALAVPILRAALACHTGMATFADAGVSDRGVSDRA